MQIHTVNRWIVLGSLVLAAGYPALVPSSAFGQAENIPQVHLNPTGISPSAECGKCHKDIFSTWENSLHAQAVDNPVFWAAFLQTFFKDRESALRNCLSCHAPIARFNQDFDLIRPLTHEGVNCDYCHSIADVFSEGGDAKYRHEFGLVKQGPLIDAKSPVHSIRFNPIYRTSAFCAGCHEYKTESGLGLIETYSEWRQSPYPDQNLHCQDCHMRKVPGKVVAQDIFKTSKNIISSHDIAGGHSLSMREKSLDIKITGIEVHRQKVDVSLEITNKGAGHKIPTGLPSKKLILEVSVRAEGGAVLQAQKITYEKKIVDERGNPVTGDVDLMLGNGLKVISDNRLAPGETRREQFTFFIPAGEEQWVSAEVYYHHNPELIQPSTIHLKILEARKLLERAP